MEIAVYDEIGACRCSPDLDSEGAVRPGGGGRCCSCRGRRRHLDPEYAHGVPGRSRTPSIGSSRAASWVSRSRALRLAERRPWAQASPRRSGDGRPTRQFTLVFARSQVDGAGGCRITLAETVRRASDTRGAIDAAADPGPAIRMAPAVYSLKGRPQRRPARESVVFDERVATRVFEPGPQ